MKIREAREKRLCTHYAAQAGMPTVGEQQLRNLEDGSTMPAEIRVRTMLEILAQFHPDVSLADFLGMPDLPFALVPTSSEAAGALLCHGARALPWAQEPPPDGEG